MRETKISPYLSYQTTIKSFHFLYVFFLFILFSLTFFLSESKRSVKKSIDQENGMDKGTNGLNFLKTHRNAIFKALVKRETELCQTAFHHSPNSIPDSHRNNQYKELQVQQVATMEAMQMKREGRRVIFRSLLTPMQPATVIVASAITRAIVPASVDRSPPLYVPRESLDDITRESSDKLTPVLLHE